MSVHSWARNAVQDDLHDAETQGYETVVALRALLSAVVQRSRALRDPRELAPALQFIADNLDDDRDYAFMRP